jgi:hypothetical protein
MSQAVMAQAKMRFIMNISFVSILILQRQLIRIQMLYILLRQETVNLKRKEVKPL